MQMDACAPILDALAILTIANVHSHFKTETHFGSSWLGPHSRILS
jgi:hypothetical protein